MSTQIIHQPVTVSEDAYVQRGRNIPDGVGDHRAEGNHRNGKYAHFSYGVVEHVHLTGGHRLMRLSSGGSFRSALMHSRRRRSLLRL